MSFDELCRSLCETVVRNKDGSLQNVVEYSVTNLLQTKSDKFQKIDELRIFEALKKSTNSAVEIRQVFELLRRIKQSKTSSDLPSKIICFLYHTIQKEDFKIDKVDKTLANYSQNVVVPSGRQINTELKPFEKLRKIEHSSVSTALNLVMNVNSARASSSSLPQPFADKVARLKEIGLMVKKIEDVIGSKERVQTPYLIFQAFQYAIQQELTEFFGLCATLSSHKKSREMTLTRIEVALFDARNVIYWMSLIADKCKEMKGCQLISTVYDFWSQSGNPLFIQLTERILRIIVEPLIRFITNFIKTGVVNDPYTEFFISVDSSVQDQDIWKKKYSLRYDMIPSIISHPQAEMILSIGRCLGFLSFIEGSSFAKSPHFLQQIAQLTSDTFIACSDEFEEKLLKIHNLVNKHVLDTFFSLHNFIGHITAIKKYLLLSQGDFVRYLMDILEPQLSKSAGIQQRHTLNIILDTAIRSTNAQYESDAIIQRLSVKLLQSTSDEIGWDVFSLYYDLSFPINTVITRESMLLYLRAFNFLWRSKRLEYTLSATWLNLMHDSRQLVVIPEMKSLFLVCFLALSNMSMFVQQMQYYLSFEVLECSWDGFVQKVRDSKELDDLTEAHDGFLGDILVRSFIMDSSLNLLEELRTIFDIISRFESHLRLTMSEAFTELERRECVGVVNGESDGLRAHKFSIHLNDHKLKFDAYLTAFQTRVKSFLSSLLSSGTDDFNFLAFRLDFNDYYFAK